MNYKESIDYFIPGKLYKCNSNTNLINYKASFPMDWGVLCSKNTLVLCTDIERNKYGFRIHFLVGKVLCKTILICDSLTMQKYFKLFERIS